MTESMSLERKHRHLTFYPGVEIREDVQALMQVLKAQETTLSEVLRPTLRNLIRQYRKEIDAYLENKKKR